MHLFNKKLETYAADHTSDEPEILKALNRRTHIEQLMPNMISGQYQGRLMALISHMIRPKTVLEIGTFTGYGTLSMAEGLHEEGVIHTIETNEELEEHNVKLFNQAGLNGKIVQHIGDAREIIPNIDLTFDLVFLDADKKHYPEYYELIIDKVNKNGIIMADNVLWYGKVANEPISSKDPETTAIDTFNKLVQNDTRVDNILLTIRDGLMLLRKKV